MPMRLCHRADGPAEIPHHFPVGDLAVVHLSTAGSLVGREELLGGSDAAQPQCVLAEAPRAHARPGEVLVRIAEMGELPVEDARQALRPDHEVAETVIAVYQYEIPSRLRVPAQPAGRQ